MDSKVFLIYLLVMALVTYAIRVIPYVCMRKEVKNKFFCYIIVVTTFLR